MHEFSKSYFAACSRLRRVGLCGALQNRESINSPQSQTLWCSAEPKVNQLTAEADSAVLHAEPRINQLTAEADSAVLHAEPRVNQLTTEADSAVLCRT